MSRMLRLAALPTVVGVLLVTGQAATATEQTPSSATVQVIADGLANPRNMLILPGGRVLVTEAGSGGPTCIGTDPDRHCLGATGGVSLVNPASGRAHRVVTGLPSLAPADGVGAAGLSDLSIGSSGRLLGIIGLGQPPSLRDTLGPDAALMGQVVQFTLTGPRAAGDIATFEAEQDPDGRGPFTNPYSLIATGSGAVALDAGGNSMVSVDRRGRVRLLHAFPIEMVEAPPFLGLPPGTTIPMEPVPTSIVVGPDGAYYVGTLAGFPFPLGASKVWRIVPGQQPTVYADGFTTILGIDFDRQGRLWVLEHTTNGFLSGDPTGALIRVEQDGTRTVVASDELTLPGGLVVTANGSVYVTNNSTSPGDGQLLLITR